MTDWRHIAALGLAIALSACSGSVGLGKGVRQDVIKQMTSAQQPMSTCYKQALTGNRKLAGKVVVSFKVEAKTGKFTQAKVRRSAIPDQAFQQCVLTAIAGLTLEKPQSTVVGVDSYPIDFSPSN